MDKGLQTKGKVTNGNKDKCPIFFKKLWVPYLKFKRFKIKNIEPILL